MEPAIGAQMQWLLWPTKSSKSNLCSGFHSILIELDLSGVWVFGFGVWIWIWIKLELDPWILTSKKLVHNPRPKYVVTTHINYMYVTTHFINSSWKVHKEIISFTQIIDKKAQRLGGRRGMNVWLMYWF